MLQPLIAAVNNYGELVGSGVFLERRDIVLDASVI